MSAKQSAILDQYFEDHSAEIALVVPFDINSDKLYPFDFTTSNIELNPAILQHTEIFSSWIQQKLTQNSCKYGIGGYNEHRTIYSRSELFGKNEEPRRLHLGVDIWGAYGTPVFAPLDGNIHSFKFNDQFGDYGATLILEHEVNGLRFNSLYGHLSLGSIANLVKGESVSKGQQIAEFGDILENGHWPPHLHFQLIFDLQGMEGDFPGVCRYSERDEFLNNCPDPQILLKHTFGY